MSRVRLRVAAVVLVALSFAVSQPPSGAQEKPKDLPPPYDRVSDTRGTVTVAGQKIDYTATAGTLVLRDEEGKAQASIYFTAYNRVTVTPPPAPAPNQPAAPVVVSPADPARPITFCFNGGPGSSAVWLHLGAFGPKRVFMPDSGEQPPAPPRLVENELSVLDFTDLVFIDPVSTGFSRAAPGVDAKRYHGVQEDVNTMGDFIHLYLTRFGRWASPKYVAGESYGTTRAAALAANLHEAHGVELSGVVLLSSVLNFATIRFDDGNDLPYVLFLPSYTVAAAYHKKLAGDLLADPKKAQAESEQFATSEYLLALMKGDKLSADDRKALAAKLSRLTGLGEDFIARANFRVDVARFCKELLRERGRTIGRFDSRLTGADADSAGERPEIDPSYTSVIGVFTGAFNQYVRKELKFESDLRYEILTNRVQPWDFGTRGGALNVAPRLAAEVRRNPSLRVFVGSGLFDLATPYFATDYTFDHLGLDAEQHKRISINYYEAGHMMYTHRPSHQKLRADLANFYGVKPPG
jgi:carboxypeptidase C (cathepsin A)